MLKYYLRIDCYGPSIIGQSTALIDVQNSDDALQIARMLCDKASGVRCTFMREDMRVIFQWNGEK